MYINYAHQIPPNLDFASPRAKLKLKLKKIKIMKQKVNPN